MSLYPDHIIWQRHRQEHHAGAVRRYEADDDDSFVPIGPNGSPVHCDLCAKTGSFAYCVPSPCESPSCEECIYLSSCSDASTDSGMEETDIFERGDNKKIHPLQDLQVPMQVALVPGSFDMHGMYERYIALL